MMKSRIVLLLFIIFSLGLLMAACGGAATPPAQPTQDPNPLYTQAAQTVVAGLTQEGPVPTNTLPATDTPAPTEPPPPTDTPVPTNTAFVIPSPTNRPPPRELIFKDNFKTDTGWFQGEGATADFALLENGYMITAKTTNAQVWSVRSVDPVDIILEVEAQNLSGPEDGYYGVTCHHQEDGKNYYALVIGNDGFFGIGKMVDGVFGFIAEGTDDEEVILTEEGTFNVIRGDCLDDQLTLYVNGKKALSASDVDYASGQIGMFVGTRLIEEDDENYVVLYNSFSVFTLPGQ